jgi:hypothetical protein
VALPARVAPSGLAGPAAAQATMVFLRRAGILAVRVHRVRRVRQERLDKRTFNKSLIRSGHVHGPKHNHTSGA